MAAGDSRTRELSSRESAEIDRSIRAAEALCRFEFSVFVGAVEGDSRVYAQRLHASLVAPARSILLLVDPTARVIEVVTGTEVRRHLTDREVELAVLQLESAFAEGDFVGGLTRGIAMLAEHARPQHTLHAGS
ncbi:DUF5130 family protein [Nocardioides sp. Soil805]|uniref:DUF5130 family protein n=1 Tax=Nocardioides sp. Soil805 TaxID=1736416 RepID=UPI000703BCB8|nr:DUF5130 family protein [Nocardioides sp. Soil805]KRF36563.1 hypothetical protein ASG94_03735 [Nocardioides sp. Soil805]